MKLAAKILIAVMSIAMLSGCGGGGGGTSTSSSSTVTVTGTVTGTKIVAVDADTGAVVSSQVATTAAAGNKKSFSISLAKDKKYKFYLVENEDTSYERVYPIQAGSSDTHNAFNFASGGTLDLGFVSTDSGVAIPTNSPTTLAGVTPSTVTDTPGVLSAVAPQGVTYSLSDLVGTWHSVGVSVGYASAGSWSHGDYTVASNGTVTVSNYSDSDGGTASNPSGTATIDTSGKILLPGGNPTGLLVMNRSKNVIIGTSSNSSDATGATAPYRFFIMMKDGAATYAATDLNNTSWNVQILGVGSTPNWQRGTASIDTSNTAAFSLTDSSNASSASSVDLSIDAHGVVTASARPTLYGVLSASKDLMLYTITAGNGPNIVIMTKARSSAATLADLSGRWREFMLAADTTYSNDFWYRSQVKVDTSGNAVVTLASTKGTAEADSTRTMSVSSGIYSISGTSYQGYLSYDGSLIIGTITGSNGTRRILDVMMR